VRRNERLEAKISPEQKRLFQRAADAQSLFLSEQAEVLRLSEADRDAMMDALLDPPAPNAKLLRAARRYQQLASK
jgi:uncharacterized protein (DUF1778 family)